MLSILLTSGKILLAHSKCSETHFWVPSHNLRIVILKYTHICGSHDPPSGEMMGKHKTARVYLHKSWNIPERNKRCLYRQQKNNLIWKILGSYKTTFGEDSSILEPEWTSWTTMSPGPCICALHFIMKRKQIFIPYKPLPLINRGTVALT